MKMKGMKHMYGADFPRIFNFRMNDKILSMLCWENHNINIDFDCKFEGSIQEFLDNNKHKHDLSDDVLKEVVTQYERYKSFCTEFNVNQIKHEISYEQVDGIPESLRNFFDEYHDVNLYDGFIYENVKQLQFSQSIYHGIISIDCVPTIIVDCNSIQIVDELKWNYVLALIVDGRNRNMIKSINSNTFERRFSKYIECSRKGTGTHNYINGQYVECSNGDFVKSF